MYMHYWLLENLYSNGYLIENLYTYGYLKLFESIQESIPRFLTNDNRYLPKGRKCYEVISFVESFVHLLCV